MKKEYSFDVLRVIAMIMVIIIHVSNVYCRSFGFINSNSYIITLCFNTISRVSVPLFFMISGALLLDREFNFKKYINRIIKYLVLIIVWDIIYLIWEYFYLGETYDELYLLVISPYRAHLWFLYSIIVIYMIQPILKFILDRANKVFKYILFILWISIGVLSMYMPFFSTNFSLVSYIGFFIFGKYLYDYLKNNDLRKYNFIFVFMLILFYAFSIYLNYKASIKFNMFYNLFFAYRTPFITFNSIIIFILVYNLFHNKKPNKIIGMFSSLSLGVYLIHGIYLDVCFNVFNYLSINVLLAIISFTIIIFILSILSVMLIKKVKYLNYIV